jgi:hypothetical protein
MMDRNLKVAAQITNASKLIVDERLQRSHVQSLYATLWFVGNL